MPRPKFEDIHPAFNGGNPYKCTNEELSLHRILLNGQSFAKTAAISGGGDVLLSTLLPKSREVFAVDHDYLSLAVAFLKTIILDKIGGRAWKGLLLEQTYPDFFTVAKEAAKDLPEPLAARVKFGITAGEYGSTLTQSDFSDLRREWSVVPSMVIEHSRKRLDAVTFVHGDVTDISKYGQFDCLYLSNACEHMTRAKTPLKMGAVSPLVREGGTLLLTSGSQLTPLKDPAWEHKRAINGTRTGWAYRLYQRKADVAT